MNNRYVYLIIVAFYVIAHVISVIDKARKERLKKQAQMQRGQTPVASQPSAAPASSREMPLETRPGWSRTPPAASGLPGPPPGVPQPSRSPSARPADDLAARRKAQLDELRRRRAQQMGAPVRPGASTRSAPTMGSPAPTPSRPPMTRQAPSDAGRLAKAEAERRRQAEAKAARERALQQALSAAGHMERQQARAAEAATSAAASQSAGAPSNPQSANAARKRAAIRNTASGATLKNRDMLRQALILRELLDPPVSIR